VVESNWTDICWRKSQASGLNGCIEIGRRNEYVYVRDSKDPNKSCIRVTDVQWNDFIGQVRHGVFDLLDS